MRPGVVQVSSHHLLCRGSSSIRSPSSLSKPASPSLALPPVLQRATVQFTAGLITAALLLSAYAAPPPALADTSDFTFRARGGSEQEAMFDNIPGSLGSSEDDTASRTALGPLIAGTRGPEVANCAKKCVTTCIRGGDGSPGLGPLSLRGELIVFKEGYRDRKYCLSECTQVCAKLVEKAAVERGIK